MKEVLKSFTHKSLSEACCDMLDSLFISYSNAVTRQSLSFRSLYRNQLSEALSKVVDNVDATYYIGNIDEETLSGSGESKSIEAVESATSEGKYESMMVFAVDIANGKTLTRSECATLTRGFNRIAAAQPVILFVREGSKLTLSTCERMDYSQEWRRGVGEKLGKVSMLKGIDCSNPHRGHIDILKSLGDKRYPSFNELYKHWMDVFSAQPLTKGFYRDLFEWYQWAVAPESKVSFPGDVSTQDDDREDIDTRVIRLITRLMFVWFIKQKGLVPDSIFDVNYLNSILKDFDPQSATDTNYYQAILQNLFFGTLNRAIIEDGERRDFAKAAKSDVKNLYRYEELFCISEDEVIELFSTVPFLNCGLFECQDKSKTLDGVEKRFYNDGFSRNEQRWKDGTYKYRATVPNVLFFHPEKGIVSIFNRYVFTIEENTPQDVQVALDPELLGKVFENLLGAYNPETKETARNQSGSFYTPREIVQYMVNESLVAHLKRTVDENLEDKFRQLLDFSTQEVELTDDQKHQIVHALFTCKILDPACGSGAFPMGMLQQMVHVLRQVDPDNNQWREVLLDMASEDSRRAFGIADEEERNKKLDEIRDTFNNALNSPDYTRKLYIIESCIYGVDIQPIAMLITRLRFFITLICEQNEIMRNKPEENFGIKTLPNLESKFVAANSLISADIHKYNNDWTQDSVLAILKDELMAIRRRHFYTRKRNEKIRLLKADEKKREQIHEHINKLVGEPNVKHIANLKNIIKEKEAELSKYQGELWREETVQIDLFSEPKVIQVDVNKLRRDDINATIANCRKDIERELSKSVPKGFEAAVLQVTDWNPYDQNTVSPFLDIEWMFGVSDGFDIVVGNPPYISTKGVKEADKLKYENEFGFSDDTYSLFTFKGLSLCKDNGALTYITPKTFWTTQTKRNMRDLLLSNTIRYIFDTANPFESAMVDTCITQTIKQPLLEGHIVKFYDGTIDLSHPIVLAPIPQNVFINTQNSVIFKPTPLNLRIYELYGKKVKELYDKWWSKIETSKKISQNHKELEAYRASLKPGDVALLGCLTEGGQGLATANNGKYIAVRRSTKWAKNIIESRPKKLAEAIKKKKIKVEGLDTYANEKDFLASLSEKEIAILFDNLKEEYGRDIFGQGYIYKIIDDNELANVDELTKEEKENGIDSSKKFYVPYDKGDKDGNRWYLETPFAIAWSKENVQYLKTDPKARYQGYTFYFREGFCWIDVNSTYLKARVKANGVFDVLSMSLFTMTKLPDWYYVSLINSEFISLYVDNFINNTSHFQINDARQLPIIIPNANELEKFQEISESSIAIKRANFSAVIPDNIAEEKLEKKQVELDQAVLKLYSI